MRRLAGLTASIDELLPIKDFDRARDLIQTHAGIQMSPAKRQLVFNRLSFKIRDGDFPSISSYLDEVERSEIARQDFIERLTTNVTSFNREKHHFEDLRTRLGVFDPLRGSRSPLIWSAGCSTGEEPISILLAIVEAFPMVEASRLPRILATDIDTKVLQTARQGRYPSASLQSIPPHLLKRCFEFLSSGEMVLRSEYLQLIEYQSLNLNQKSWSMPPRFSGTIFDFVFCRNVMIYFGLEVQRTLLKRLYERIKPHGMLYVGHSEMLLHSDDLYESKGRTIFQSRRRSI